MCRFRLPTVTLRTHLASFALLLSFAYVATPRASAQEPSPELHAPPPPAAAPAAPAAPAASNAAESSVVEVVVKSRNEPTGVERSANAVTVVDLQRAKHESADMATVLARVEGVNVQRVGGLGSAARFTLAGFDEKQVRFFIDGVPLEYSGYPFGLQNVPVNFAERVEVYKGVVPVRLGADALGGAFELITDRSTNGTRASGSFEAGSFGTYRLSAGARHRDQDSGLFVKAETFFDRADNDYPIQVKVADRTGVRREATVYRFHDAYAAEGGNVEAGWVDRPWAKRLLLRAFVTGYDKELQHNVFMTVPYGEARESGHSRGASLRYENHFGPEVFVSTVGGYVYDRSNFSDETECIYDWFGRCPNPQRVPGEVGNKARDQSLWDHTGYLRANLRWSLHPDHQLRFAIAPTYFTRDGNDRRQPPPDPASDPRRMLRWINGVEYEVDLLDGALENVVTVKSYVQSTRGKDFTGTALTVDRESRRTPLGAGDSLRYDIFDWLFAKVSYEYAVRLAEPIEVFGSGSVVAENMELRPERSHNLNLTLAIDELDTQGGTLRGNVTGFFRGAEDLIVRLSRDDIFRYENVTEATVYGIEGALGWLSPGEYVELGANATFQDLRNTSSEGPFEPYSGDRIPNRPYFWANGTLRLQARELFTAGDELSFTWYARYVHAFHRNWENIGREDTQELVPSQLVHTAVIAYVIERDGHALSFAGEMHDVTDEKVYDFYGVQLPGRAAYLKATFTY